MQEGRLSDFRELAGGFSQDLMKEIEGHSEYTKKFLLGEWEAELQAALDITESRLYVASFDESGFDSHAYEQAIDMLQCRREEFGKMIEYEFEVEENIKKYFTLKKKLKRRAMSLSKRNYFVRIPIPRIGR